MEQPDVDFDNKAIFEWQAIKYGIVARLHRWRTTMIYFAVTLLFRMCTEKARR